jgi:protein-arginine kinase activator protein McsA
MERCKKCNSEDLKIGITHTQSKSTIYPLYCNACGDVSTRYVKKEIAMEYEKQNGILKYVKTKTKIMMEKHNKQIHCEVCDVEGGELHHWAPQYLFNDAEKWPKSYLCRTCHKRWHDLVTPNMNKKEAKTFF